MFGGGLKTHFLTKSTISCEKNLEKIENAFFISVKKRKKEKKCQKKSFSVFGEAYVRPLNTLKLFLVKCSIIFFSRL